MSTARNIIKNTILLSGQNLFIQIVGVFVIGYVASEVGAADYGIFVFSLSFVSIFTLVANLGTRIYATREIAGNKEQVESIFTEILSLRCYLAVIAGLTALMTIMLLPYSGKALLLVKIAIISQVCTWFYTNTFIVYEAYERMAFPVTIDVVVRVFVLIAIVASIYFGYGIVGVSICYALGNFIEIFAAFYFFKKNFFKPQLKFFPVDLSRKIELVKISLPFCLISVFRVLISESDKIMISMIEGASAVGIYGVAFVLSVRLSGVMDALATAFFPVVIRFKKELQFEGFRSKMTEGLQVVAVIAIPVSLGVFVVSEDIIKLIYRNSEFLPAVLTLKLLIIGLPFSALSFLFNFSLLSEGRQKVLVKVNCFILLVNLLFNYYLISIMSFNGAAIATVVSIALKFACLVWLSGKIVIWKEVLKVVIISLLIGVVMCWLVVLVRPISLLASVLLGAIFYGSMTLLTGTIKLSRLKEVLKVS